MILDPFDAGERSGTGRPLILLLGKDGRLGWELRRTLAPLGNVIALGSEADVRRSAAFAEIIGTGGAAAIVNAAAYTDVDGAEHDRETAFAVNARAPGMLAREAARIDALFIHFSTDYVFDGRATEPYTEQDEPAPINLYGESKLAGEHAIAAANGPHLIFRTSWLYSMRRPGFLHTVLRHTRAGEPINVVNDHIGSPTWSRFVAEATALALSCIATGAEFMLDPEEWGVYHVCATGYTSRYEFARAIAMHDPHTDPRAGHALTPVPSREFPQPAARPAFSALDSSHFANTFLLQLPHWEEQLACALDADAGAAHDTFNSQDEPPRARPG